MKKSILIMLMVLGGTIAVNAQCNAKATCSKSNYTQCSKLDKNSKEYKLCYEKLKDLELKRAESPSYNKSVRISRAFDKKLSQKIEASLYSNEYAFNQWIEKNIHTTNFGTVADAKDQWKKINTAYKIAVAENKEYYDYMSELALSVENASEIIAGATSTVAYENIYRQD